MKRSILFMLFIIYIAAEEQVFAQADSLMHYLTVAAENNPALRVEFLNYRASLEKIPQAGAIPDPQLEMGFFLKPMEIIDGKQVADFKLMQMFPWFGTRRAARSEMAEMARMSYEQFRQKRENLFFDVKSAWWGLQNLQQQLTNIGENKVLLTSLKTLALQRFASPLTQGVSNSGGAARNMSATTSLPPAGGMSSEMGGMATTGATGVMANPSSSGAQTSSGMGKMPGSSGMTAGSQGGMSNVLRIDMELNELLNEEQAILSQITSATAKFNTLLNRSADEVIVLPDTITQLAFSVDNSSMLEAIRRQNPMLSMATAEAAAYEAKLRMDKRMGLPMIGIGLQYSVISKRMAMGIPTTDMNGKDMLMPMLSLTIPLYRNKYRAQQNESRLMREAAADKYQSALNDLTAEYLSVREQLANAQRKITLYEQQRQLALVTYQLAVNEFAAGIGSIANVLDVERQLLDYKLKRSEAVATYNTVIAMIENLLSDTQTE